jgi:hypothetical protein
MDLLETAWGIIANASEGDWDQESDDWQGAAVRWRDHYYELLRTPSQEGLDRLTAKMAELVDKDPDYVRFIEVFLDGMLKGERRA